MKKRAFKLYFPNIFRWVAFFSILSNGILIWWLWPQFSGKVIPADQCMPLPGKQNFLPIQIATAKKEAISRKIKVNGTIKAINSVSIMSEAQGKITQINFKEGDKVKKGEILIQLEDSQARAKLKEAEGHVMLAQGNYTREKYLFDKNMGAKARLEKAAAEKITAIAARDNAVAHLKQMRIEAPFDGKIGLINLSVGSQVTPNQEITRIVGQAVEVKFQVTEVEASYLKKGQEVDILAGGLETLPTTGKIVAINPYSDPVAHSVEVKASVIDPEDKFHDGTFVPVIIGLTNDEEAVVIPKDAILSEGGQDFVFVVIGNRVQKKAVITGAIERNRIQIIDGIAVDDVVATDPIDVLVDGTPVKIDTII